jgi:hypothetical protein
MFKEFGNVAPFAAAAGGGLGSLGDLKSQLPFESKASSRVTLGPQGQGTSKPIAFPTPPKAPRPPAALAITGLKPSADAWKKYVEEFHGYMEEFADFNARIVDHFAARRKVIQQNREATAFDWLESRGDSGLQEYLQWLDEDKHVRQKWMSCCDIHELTVREFMKHREKMMQ